MNEGIYSFMKGSIKKRGKIFAIGGSAKEAVLKEVIKASQKPEPVITLIASASSLSNQEILEDYRPLFNKISKNQLLILHPISDDECNDKNMIDTIKRSDVIFFTGGDQQKLVETLADTDLLKAIIEQNKKGAVLAGTSAGAAAFSNPMINGGQPKNAPVKGAIYTHQGFDILERTIIDTHFSQRVRLPRLFNLVAQHPDNIGIGLDENTALMFDSSNVVEVVGEGVVTFVNGSNLQSTSTKAKNREHLTFDNMKVASISKGMKYDLSSRKVLSP
jgi:cyanophycinase